MSDHTPPTNPADPWEMPCRWQAAAEALPKVAGKYVVEVDAGFDMVYLSTRSFNPENKPGQQWLNMGMGETVTHWVSGLRSVSECRAYESEAKNG